MSTQVFRRFKSIGLTLSALALIGVMAGCGSEKKDETGDNNDTESNENDGHIHHHVHGPNNGEVFEIPDSEMFGEWKGKYDQNMVDFYILDADKKEIKVKAANITIKTQGREPQTFTVEAVNADDDGMASHFQHVDETMALQMKNVGVDFEIEIDGKKYSGHIHKDPH